MERYLQFTNKDGSTFLVEVDEEEVLSPGGMEKAGLKDKVKEIGGKMVVTAQELFEDAVDNMIQSNTKAFLQAIRNLSEQDQPEWYCQLVCRNEVYGWVMKEERSWRARSDWGRRVVMPLA